MEGNHIAGSINGIGVSEDEYCMEVENGFTPYVGQEFFEIEEAINFYKIYALASGFDVRKYTTKKWYGGEIKSKLLVCNRQGFNPKRPISEHESKKQCGASSSKKCKSLRVGCKARLRLFIRDGVIVIDRFDAGHNHVLISARDREFQKLSRNLTDYHKMTILSNSRLRIGASRTYKMCKEHVNGFQNIGATLNDFKNFHRDVKCFIHERDGQLFIDHFKEMAKNRPGFYFDYDVDDDGSLSRAVWADSIARTNYSVFGDAVSFDPTYSTNKYSMVFTPFTGVDNHGRSVTFCGALIAKEDHESFSWVFSRFLIAMGGKEPEYIITDQDPGIIKSVPLVFKTARHRFCMWHIMNKVPGKFGVTRSDYSEFMKSLSDIVWDEDLEPLEFDARWAEIIEKHGLVEDSWFADTYAIRSQWVMAHCRDLKMGAIMRTTQRSESENSFFKRFESKSGTLVEFWMRFVSAMDQQVHTRKTLDYADRHSSPTMSTHLAIERHAAAVYTYSGFYRFREEVRYSIDTCRAGGFVEGSEVEVTTVKDALRNVNFGVIYNPGTFSASCSCRNFERTGILCRHIIWIYSSNGLKTIPEAYICRRWTKDATPSNMFAPDGKGMELIDNVDGQQIAMSTMWSEVHQTVSLLRERSEADVDLFSSLIREFKKNLSPVGEPLNKQQQLEKMLGCTATDDIHIFPPKLSKNKGSGKRMLSNKTKAIAIASKPKRMCKNCKQMANHDKRNCPNNYADHSPSPHESSGHMTVPGSESEDEDEEEEEDEKEEDEYVLM